MWSFAVGSRCPRKDEESFCFCRKGSLESRKEGSLTWERSEGETDAVEKCPSGESLILSVPVAGTSATAAADSYIHACDATSLDWKNARDREEPR